MKNDIIPNSAILIHSGGLDSTTLLFHLLDAGCDVRCLGVNYGQRHVKELGAAKAICSELKVEQRVVDLSSIKDIFGGGSLTNSQSPIPEGHYTDSSMKATVVPNRNMMMLSFAISWCASLKLESVAYAAHTGDHCIYPDCRPEFIEAMKQATRLCDWHPIELYTPFDTFSKGDIVKRAAELNVPFEKTWSCYKGESIHCGLCGTCVERKEAFQVAGIKDPTKYSS